MKGCNIKGSCCTDGEVTVYRGKFRFSRVKKFLARIKKNTCSPIEYTLFYHIILFTDMFRRLLRPSSGCDKMHNPILKTTRFDI